MRCGECRHWGSDEDAGQRFRACRAVVHDAGSRTADEAFADYDDAGDAVLDLPASAVAYREAHRAVVVDGSGYFAALKTRDDFGCVLFEAREG